MEERYSFDLILIPLCYTTGITNVITQLRNIPFYSLGRKNGYHRVQRNCSTAVTAYNPIKCKCAEQWEMWENVFLLGVARTRGSVESPTGTRLRSSWLFVSTSVPL